MLKDVKWLTRTVRGSVGGASSVMGRVGYVVANRAVGGGWLQGEWVEEEEGEVMATRRQEWWCKEDNRGGSTLACWTQGGWGRHRGCGQLAWQ